MFSDFAILEALLHKGPQPVSELGRRIDLTSGSMTAAIDRLETRNLVARADHATDRRAWVIHLTPEGEALITHTGRNEHMTVTQEAVGTKLYTIDKAHSEVEFLVGDEVQISL